MEIIKKNGGGLHSLDIILTESWKIVDDGKPE
jgi:hypothetical protein